MRFWKVFPDYTVRNRVFPATHQLCEENIGFQQYKYTRIETVGKPYREVCLRSELWHWMAHQPNSWSKHPGTRIEQVLAYCRDEQKYVGWIELLFCLTVTMTFGVQTWKFIGLMDVILPIYQPSFTEIRSKIREKISVQHIFPGCLLVTLTYVPEIYIKSSPCQGLSTS